MSNFLTIKAAKVLVEKSASSIRRIIYRIVKDDHHPDRDQISPSVDEVKALRLVGQNFPWKITEELLRREFKDPVPPTSTRDSARSSPSSAEGELLAMLRGELGIKNQQIAQQAELISKQADLVSGLSERLREGNVLMASLQQRLALGAGRDGKADAAVDAVVTESTPIKTSPEKSAKAEKSGKPEKGSTVSAKSAPPKRKRFFSRLFS